MKRASVEHLRKPNTTCQVCGKAIYKKPYLMARQMTTTCSHRCSNIAHPRTPPANHPGKINRGAKNGSWKGGVTYRRRHGNYVSVRYVRCPAQLLSMARADGYVMEHRLVMAQLCGRSLERAEVVHHADHNPLNNTPSNLELWPDNRSHKMWEHGNIAIGAACRL